VAATATPEQLAAFIAAHLDYGRLAAEIVLRLENVTPPRASELVSAKEIGGRIGRTARWVRQHKSELGAVALSNGPRPRLGFDPAYVDRAMAARRL
jgi:hypothetical protein